MKERKSDEKYEEQDRKRPRIEDDGLLALGPLNDTKTDNLEGQASADVAETEADNSYETAQEAQETQDQELGEGFIDLQGTQEPQEPQGIVVENTQFLSEGNKENPQDLLLTLATRFHQATSSMEYLKYEEMLDNGQAVELHDEHRVADDPRLTFSTSPQEIRYGLPTLFSSNKSNNRSSSGKEYWKGNAPVEEKADYNGEMLMLPIMAPRDEPQVTIRNVILECTVSAIENHQGGPKVNWFWKTQMLATRMMHVAPALLFFAKNILPTLTDLNTLNVYVYSDASLYGNTIQKELAIDDPGDANAVLAAS